ncbi:MAG: hypothetical protein HGA36_00295 [Candidatus Moranbacteria bacterium]|nr:hypothetical protein [Candidatus Moranbacteria bacterium]
MFKKIDKQDWLHCSLILVVAVMGTAYAVYLGFSAHENSKENLLTRANTIAQFVTAKDIALLHGSEDDLNNPAYLRLKNRLMSLQAVNPDMRFIYLNGMKDGSMFFYADSESADSSEYSNPGQQYSEASDLMKHLFQEKTSGFEIAGDRWGMWASAMIPIIDKESGNIVALLGVDVAAKKYLTDILIYCLSALLFTALVILLLIWQKRAARYVYLTEGSLKANNLEVMNLMKIIKEKEQKIEEIRKGVS